MDSVQVSRLPARIGDMDNGGLPIDRPPFFTVSVVTEAGCVARFGVDDLRGGLVGRLRRRVGRCGLWRLMRLCAAREQETAYEESTGNSDDLALLANLPVCSPAS